MKSAAAYEAVLGVFAGHPVAAIALLHALCGGPASRAALAWFRQHPEAGAALLLGAEEEVRQ